MNKVQANVYWMSTATMQLFNESEVLLNTFPVIVEQKQIIEALIQEVELYKDNQNEGNTTAHTKTKNELLEELSERTSKVALKARGLAKVTNDNNLLKRVDFSRYEISNGSDQETLDTADKILKAAKEKEALLIENYNLNNQEIAALGVILLRISSLINKRKVIASGSKASTTNLSEVISELRKAWSVMDDLIRGIIEDEDFVDTYDNIRRIGD